MNTAPFCSSCGAKIEEKYRFCPFCGTKCIDISGNTDENGDNVTIIVKQPVFIECAHCSGTGIFSVGNRGWSNSSCNPSMPQKSGRKRR